MLSAESSIHRAIAQDLPNLLFWSRSRISISCACELTGDRGGGSSVLGQLDRSLHGQDNGGIPTSRTGIGIVQRAQGFITHSEVNSSAIVSCVPSR